jgi:tetratricopeptide (TPR) repeat protein
MSSIGPSRYDAFLSYNSQDYPAVQHVADQLKKEGLEPYLEVWELAPGEVFQPRLAEALHQSKSCVVFLGPNGLGPYQKEELQVAIDKRVRDEAFRVIPVLLPGAERPRRGDVAHLEFLINASWVEFLKTLDDQRAFRQLVWGITGTRPPEPDATRYEGICPYRGLEAFRPDDAKFFFGRDNLTGWLVSALRREVRAAQGVRFLGVLGPSGSGKSSVVLAGLVPRLTAGAIEGSERWPVALLRPGDDPLKNLAAGIVPLFLSAGALPDAAQVLKLVDDLRADARTLDVFTQMALHDQPEDVRLVVVVDQFEEVFAYRPQDDQARARSEQDRDQFFANLLRAAAAPGGRAAVVLTMRSDFLSGCATFPQLAAVLSAHQELVGPMTAAELREAIEQPALRVGCEAEPGLIERLLADVEGQPGALPLLQFALTEVWREREVRRLTLRAYTELGKDDKGEPRGIEGVLEHRADEIFRNLKPEDQDLCRWLFLQLVQLGEGTEDTKRRVSYCVLRPDDPTRYEAVLRLIRTLADRDARLITTEGTDTADGAVEVAHEALVRGWSQLRRWVDAERAGLRIQRRLTEAAQEWAAARPEHKDDYLYSGARLAVSREWVETHRNELSSIEAAFLAASDEAEGQRKQDALENERRLRAAAEAAREAEQQRAEEAQARAEGARIMAAAERKARRRTTALAAVTVAALVASGTMAWWLAGRRAEDDREVDAALAKADHLLDLAERAGSAAKQLELCREAEDAARQAVKRAEGGFTSAAARQQASEAQSKTEQARIAAERDRDLLTRLRDARSPGEVGAVSTLSGVWEELQEYRTDPALAESVLELSSGVARDLMPATTTDELFADAFRKCRLDVNERPPEEVVAFISTRPVWVRTDVVAALDEWAAERRHQGRPKPDWQRLSDLADRIDRDHERQALRSLLAGDRLRRERLATELGKALLPLTALGEPTSGSVGAELRKRARRPGTAEGPVLEVLLLSRALREAGDDAEAEKLLRSAMVRQTREAAYLDALGQLLEAQRPPRWSEAVECYQRLRLLRPELGKNLARALGSAGRWAEAFEHYDQLCRQQPENPGYFSEFITVLFEQRKFDEMGRVCREAIRHHRKLAVFHYCYAYALSRQSLHKQAEERFREAIDLQPDKTVFRNHFGYVFFDQDRYKEAADEFSAVTKLAPKFAVAPYMLGHALWRQDRYEEAGKAYREATKRHRGFAQAWNNLGVALSKQGLLKEAEATFRKAMALRPDSDYVWYNLCLALVSLERLNEAVTTFEKMDMRGYLSAGRARAEWIIFFKDPAEQEFYHSAPRVDPVPGTILNLYPRTFCFSHAARAAARAAAGKGKDAETIDAARRVKLRRLALGWIRADLDQWSGYLRSDNLCRPIAMKMLQGWMCDPDLAGLRDPDAVAKLPCDEQKGWRRIWADVEGLLKKAQDRSRGGRPLGVRLQRSYRVHRRV